MKKTLLAASVIAAFSAPASWAVANWTNHISHWEKIKHIQESPAYKARKAAEDKAAAARKAAYEKATKKIASEKAFSKSGPQGVWGVMGK